MAGGDTSLRLASRVVGVGVRFSVGVAAVFMAFVLLAAVGAVAAPARVSYQANVAPIGAEPLRLHVEEHGLGPVVLLIHGLGASSYAWRHIVPRLARTHRVIAIDLKGFGNSDKPFDLAYSPQDQARLLATFLARRGVRRVSVVGHSFGGAVALMLALELNRAGGGRLERLVLIDTPAFPQRLPFRYTLLTQPVLPYLGLMLVPPEVTASASLTSDQSDPRRISLADIRAYARPLYESGARHALITTLRRFVGDDARAVIARYPTIRQPTLLVWCRADSVVPLANALRLRRSLGQAQLHVMDGCDHVPNEEAPEALAATLAHFLAR